LALFSGLLVMSMGVPDLEQPELFKLSAASALRGI
jgi:hypothetical protein